MKYYRVNPEYDGLQVLKPIYSGHYRIDRELIANELYTEKEYEKLTADARFRGYGFFGVSADKLQSVFLPENYSKKSVYFFFGTRFASMKGE